MAELKPFNLSEYSQGLPDLQIVPSRATQFDPTVVSKKNFIDLEPLKDLSTTLGKYLEQQYQADLSDKEAEGAMLYRQVGVPKPITEKTDQALQQVQAQGTEVANAAADARKQGLPDSIYYRLSNLDSRQKIGFIRAYVRDRGPEYDAFLRNQMKGWSADPADPSKFDGAMAQTLKTWLQNTGLSGVNPAMLEKELWPTIDRVEANFRSERLQSTSQEIDDRTKESELADLGSNVIDAIAKNGVVIGLPELANRISNLYDPNKPGQTYGGPKAWDIVFKSLETIDFKGKKADEIMSLLGLSEAKDKWSGQPYSALFRSQFERLGEVSKARQQKAIDDESKRAEQVIQLARNELYSLGPMSAEDLEKYKRATAKEARDKTGINVEALPEWNRVFDDFKTIDEAAQEDKLNQAKQIAEQNNGMIPNGHPILKGLSSKSLQDLRTQGIEVVGPEDLANTVTTVFMQEKPVITAAVNQYIKASKNLDPRMIAAQAGQNDWLKQTMIARTLDRWQLNFSNALKVNGGDAFRAREAANEALKKEIQNGDIFDQAVLNRTPSTPTTRVYQAAVSYGPQKVLTSLIPGIDSVRSGLEAFNVGRTSALPDVFYRMQANFGGQVTAMDIAKAQYKLLTGKELNTGAPPKGNTPASSKAKIQKAIEDQNLFNQLIQTQPTPLSNNPAISKWTPTSVNKFWNWDTKGVNGPAAVSAVILGESPQNHDNYDGSGATGYGQVMPDNIGPWTKKFFGKTLTQDEFRANKEAQMITIHGQAAENLKQLVEAGYRGEELIRRFAAIWYSGDSSLWNNNRKQTYNGKPYPSVAEYTKDKWQRYLKLIKG